MRTYGNRKSVVRPLMVLPDIYQPALPTYAGPTKISNQPALLWTDLKL